MRPLPASSIASSVASSSRAVLPSCSSCSSSSAGARSMSTSPISAATGSTSALAPAAAAHAAPVSALPRPSLHRSGGPTRQSGCIQDTARQQATGRWTTSSRSAASARRTLATAAATAAALTGSERSNPNPTPAVHLPTLARLSPTAYNSLRPAPLSSISAFAARLHPAFLPRAGEGASAADSNLNVRARRLALVQQALTHPSWFSLLEQTRLEHPEAFVAAAASNTLPLGLGRGVVVEDIDVVRGEGADAAEDGSPSNLTTESSNNPRVQSVLLAASQYLSIPDPATVSKDSLHNASLANLGNSLLGLFASEHLHLRYPHIPTRVLKAALASYVGPSTSADVALELGLQGKLVRWDPTRLEERPSFKLNPAKPRTEAGMAAALEDAAVKERQRKLDLALARVNRRKKGFVGSEGELRSEDDGSAQLRRQDVFASVMRALVAVLYQEMGITASRQFVSSHFLTRLVPLPAFLKFNDPKRVLSSTLEKYGLPPPQSRLIAETGRLSINPVFVVGIWSDQNKIGEGSGSSLRMAEYRAAEDAMRRMYLAESDPAGFQVPSLTIDVPSHHHGPSLPTDAFVAQPLGRSEVVQGSHA